MSLENVRDSLIQEAKKEEKRIMSTAEKEASAIIDKAKDQAKQIKAEEKKKALETVSGERNEKISTAKLKANKIVSEAKNKLVDDSVEAIWEDFKDSPKKKGYAGFLKKQIKEAEKELGNTIVTVNSSDLKATKKYSKNIQKQGVNISGGAIVFTKDRSVSIDGSLESIFENNKEEIRGTIFKELFK